MPKTASDLTNFDPIFIRYDIKLAPKKREAASVSTDPVLQSIAKGVVDGDEDMVERGGIGVPDRVQHGAGIAPEHDYHAPDPGLANRRQDVGEERSSIERRPDLPAAEARAGAGGEDDGRGVANRHHVGTLAVAMPCSGAPDPP